MTRCGSAGYICYECLDQELLAQGEQPEPGRKPWRGNSQDTIGVAVQPVRLLIRTDDVAAMVSGMMAYPTGFKFDLVLISRG
jgi:hypothetical protein